MLKDRLLSIVYLQHLSNNLMVHLVIVFLMFMNITLLSHTEAICKKFYQFLKTLMKVERSFTVNCLFITFIKQSNGTFSDCFFNVQEYYFVKSFRGYL